MQEIIRWIIHKKRSNPSITKRDVTNLLLERTDLIQKRSVISNVAYSIRVCEVNVRSFSNVVLSLSAQIKYDHLPFIVCAVSPETVFFRLANTTFLKKISHSSENLKPDNIRGSFLGTDIMTEYNSIKNTPNNFIQLFSVHQRNNRRENLIRLSNETNQINSTTAKFVVTRSARRTILQAPNRFAKMLNTPEWRQIEDKYRRKVNSKRSRIFELANIENNKIRGREIEKIFTSSQIKHDIGDMEFTLSDNTILIVDIKSKLKHLSSSPKAYNIDKFLKLLSDKTKGFAFLFIAIDLEKEVIETKLVQPFDPIVIDATRIQHHWAGRGSRGVTQLTTRVNTIFDKNFHQTVDQAKAVTMLTRFIEA